MPTIRTPYYLIDERHLQGNLETIARVREASGAKSVLALKCFSTCGVFGLMRQYVDGTTSSSLYEARLGREEIGKEVHAYSVAFDGDEIASVATLADKVIFNSISQLDAFHDQVRHLSVGLRVNPGVSYSHFDLADPARRHSRLGVTDDASLRAVVSQLDGLMFHFNCENDDFDALATAIGTIADRYGDVLRAVQWISLGGGISFTAPDYPIERFTTLLQELTQHFGVEVYLEPGEAAITGSAELVTSVVDVVHNEVDIAVVDASVEAHMLDHLIYSTHPRVSSPAAGTSPVTIAGRTCLAGDVFGEYGLDHALAVGDEVRFADAAGYTMVKANWFNGLRMPSIVVRRLDGSIDVVREFDYEDFKDSLS
ncbi:MAG: carboxynorspermidine decarboxylase [Actinobacteria bacterium]|nr:carboxynorspermidine decarboxylase [Actinomycetota bacterium]